MSTDKASADAERDRMLQAIMLADLGSERRDKCTTSDATRARADAEALNSQRRSHVEGSAAQRQSEIDREQLNRWNTFYQTVDDTGHMENLPDIAAGQTHRAALQASMRALETQHAQRGAHGFGGRGGGISGSRGRGGFSPRQRTTSVGAIAKPGRPGPANRSATMSFGLDPALNVNNDPNESDSRNRGRGTPRGPRGSGRARGKQQSPTLSTRPVPSKRPQRPEVNFSSNLVDPVNFMTSYRRATGAASTAGPESVSAPLPIPPVSTSLPLGQPEKIKTASAHTVARPETPKPAVSVAPVDKSLQFGQPKTPTATPKPVAVVNLGGHQIKAPTSPSKPAAARKILPLKKSRSGHSAAHSVTVQPPDIGPLHKEIKWNISPGEFPRKKEPAGSVGSATKSKVVGDGKVSFAHPTKQKNPPDKSHIGPKSTISAHAPQITPTRDASKAKKAQTTGGGNLNVSRTPKSQNPQGASLLDSANSPLPVESLQSQPIKTEVQAQKAETARTPKSKQVVSGSLLDTANSPLSTQPLKNVPTKPKIKIENVKAEHGQNDSRPLASDDSNSQVEGSKVTGDIPSGSILDMANQPLNEEALQIPLSAMTPASKAHVAKSPGTTELLGLEFAADESPKSIDAVLSRAEKILPTSNEAEFERLLAQRVEEEVAIRLKHAREILKRPGEHARFEDWLNQADKNEAAVIQDALRKASFTRYRSPERVEAETDSSNEPTPEGKLKSLLSTPVKDEFMNRFPVPGILASGPRATDVTSKAVSVPVQVVSASTQTATASTQAVKASTQAVTASNQGIPAPIRITPVPTTIIQAKAASKTRSAPKQSLLDSIYAFQPEEPAPAPAPRVFSGNIPKPRDPKAAGVQLIGPAPYDKNKKPGHSRASSVHTQAENVPVAASVESESGPRVKVIGVQPYIAGSRRK
ncbi:hypothetical protein N7452_005937 [Penicillium brevicompactum]|uniref:Uncharacterized protein n=1 Tax=Penicillium brevicompactum TaxID=5074 RepID=A0A9W9QMI2_PENBR|nr:hypothetical protein N7452_005937 [Penicillium brevicompactum]